MTKIPQEIIAKAVQGGWEQKYTFDEVIALDKDFWIALGKSLGWGMELGDRDNGAWKYKALHFYELILNEQETDSFWQNLLDSK